MTARAAFRQADLTRALRAANDAGCQVARIRIDTDGAIDIIMGGGEPAPTPHTNPLDRLHAPQTPSRSLRQQLR